VVHFESRNNNENLGNIHPIKMGKHLTKNFSFISKIGKTIIVVNFKYRHEANSFVDNDSNLPDNWIGYIPNYKVYRTGVVRGVDISLSEDEIRQGVKFLDNNMEIRTRLKYRDRFTMKLKDSQSVKMEFALNLLPEYLSICSVKSNVRPYINRVRKCFNCFRWGHSAIFCRRKFVPDVEKNTIQRCVTLMNIVVSGGLR